MRLFRQYGKIYELGFYGDFAQAQSFRRIKLKKGKHGFNLKPNLVHFPPSNAAVFTTGAPDVVWRNAWSCRWPKP